MLSQKKYSTLYLPVLLVSLMLLPACGLPDKAGGAAQPKSDKPASGTLTPGAADDTPVPLVPDLPETFHEEGKAEIEILRTLSIAASNQGFLSQDASGTVPVKILYNEKKGVWEVKGTGWGPGKTKFTSSECNCQAAWGIEYTISGVLVPLGGLIADPTGGCYIQLHINEDWGSYQETCNCSVGSGMVSVSPEDTNFGPLKFDLVENDAEVSVQLDGDAKWDYLWKIKNLDVPMETGCMVADVIQR